MSSPLSLIHVANKFEGKSNLLSLILLSFSCDGKLSFLSKLVINSISVVRDDV